MIGAAAAWAAGDSDTAIVELRKAIALADRLSTMNFATSARYRLAGLVGGEEGRGLLRAVEQFATAQDVRRIDRFANIVIPGAWPNPPA